MIKKITFLFIIALSSFLCGEEFELKDGTIIKGEKIVENEISITVKTSFGEISINKVDLIVKEYKVKLKSGDILVGEIIQTNNDFIELDTKLTGKTKIYQSEIISIEELNIELQNNNNNSERTYYGPFGLFGNLTSVDKDANFTIGQEQLIDLFLDPTGHTLKRGTLYLSGLSFGVGVTDKFQITTKWGDFFWGNLNLRPKLKLFEKGNWEKQQSLSIGAHIHNRWWPNNKYKWQSGSIDYNEFSIRCINCDDNSSENDRYLQEAPMKTTKKYWGEFLPVGSNKEYSYSCEFPSTDIYDPTAINAEYTKNPEEYCSEINSDHEDGDGILMTEFFGAYTFSKARPNLKGRISHTIGAHVQVAFIDNGLEYKPNFLYRAYYGLDIDITAKLKMISELFYDPYYREWWRDSGGYYDESYTCEDDCDWELGNFSNEAISKEDMFPVFVDFGFVYAFNSHFRVAIHFQQPIIGFYWKL